MTPSVIGRGAYYAPKVARLLRLEAPDTMGSDVHRWAFGRETTLEEVALGLKFLRSPTEAGDKMTAWEQYAQAILASNEFVWVD